MKIVLDTSILVRANEHSFGLARKLLTGIVNSEHRLTLERGALRAGPCASLSTVTSFLRPSEHLIYEYIVFLRRSSEIVTLNSLVMAPIRDVNDVIVIQTAIIGEADILCSRDEDFFEPPASDYLKKMGITVMDDIGLMKRLRV